MLNKMSKKSRSVKGGSRLGKGATSVLGLITLAGASTLVVIACAPPPATHHNLANGQVKAPAPVASATDPAHPQTAADQTTPGAPTKPVKLEGAASCVFKSPYVFGASISASTMKKYVPKLRALSALGLELPAFLNADFGDSPIDMLSVWAQGKIVQNVAAEFAEPTGSVQVQKMLATDTDKLLSATVIAGIDAFYWDAIRGKCDEAVTAVAQITTFAKAKKKTLILGNVPIENAETVPLAKLPQAMSVGWEPPKPACVDKINRSIVALCLVENRCFMLDVKTFVANLNKNGFYQSSADKKFTTEQVRPDGVHLSTVGSNIVGSIILKQLRQRDDQFLCQDVQVPQSSAAPVPPETSPAPVAPAQGSNAAAPAPAQGSVAPAPAPAQAGSAAPAPTEPSTAPEAPAALPPPPSLD